MASSEDHTAATSASTLAVDNATAAPRLPYEAPTIGKRRSLAAVTMLFTGGGAPTTGTVTMPPSPPTP